MGENRLDSMKTSFQQAAASVAFSEEEGDLAAYASDGLIEAQGVPLCVVKPGNADEVIRVVKAGVETGAGLIPFSSTPPRFRGDTAIPREGTSVAVDLSGMKRIVRMDRRNKVAIIEPGVTFDELQRAAGAQRMKALTPLLPRATKSVVASYLEREPITIPKYHWDMTDPMLCVEVVFGTGDVFRTGGAAGPGSLEEQWAAGSAQKCPLGPAQTDLLRILQGAQGTLGIVTWASIKLELLPALRHSYFITSPEIEPLVELVYEMTRLRLGDEMFILNNFSLANIIGEEPGSIQGLMNRPAGWTLFYSVAGYEYFPELRVKHQEEDVARLVQRAGLESKSGISGVSAAEMAALTDLPSKAPFWKTRYKGACREILFLTTMDQVSAHLDIMKAQAQSFSRPAGEVGVYLQPIQQGRACHLEFVLPYNHRDPTETGNVYELFLSASRAHAEAGGFFSRPYGPWADIAYAKCPDTVEALNRIKEIVDPDRVFNPGKLCFRAA